MAEEKKVKVTGIKLSESERAKLRHISGDGHGSLSMSIRRAVYELFAREEQKKQVKTLAE